MSYNLLDIRDELISIGNSIYENRKRFANYEIMPILEYIDKQVIVVNAAANEAHLMPRLPVFRRNYDYDEGWNRVMDDFRAGKIKGIRDFIKKKRKRRKIK